jgi:hypothetical protein
MASRRSPPFGNRPSVSTVNGTIAGTPTAFAASTKPTASC